MIGGIDIRLPSAAGLDSLEVAVRAVRQLWPLVAFENGNTGERYESFWDIPFREVEELFVYRDSDVAEVWNDKGAVPEVNNTMIHLLYEEGLITAVIDERTREMETILNAIRSGLDDTIHSISALEAA
jgi:hypothetical protein